MTDPTPTRRRFSPTPAWLVYGLLVAEGLLWLSERYRWFWFNEKKGWTVLIGVAAVGVAMLVMLGWFVASQLFRWRFQFSIRSLLTLVVAVALPCSWLAVEMKEARNQKKTVEWIYSVGGIVYYDWQQLFEFWGPNAKSPDSLWLRNLLGVDFFHNVDDVCLYYDTNATKEKLAHYSEVDEVSSKVTDAELKHIEGLKGVQALKLQGSQFTDAAIDHFIGFTQLKLLWLHRTKITDSGLERLQELRQLRDLSVTSPEITDEGVKSLQQALPNCKIDR